MEKGLIKVNVFVDAAYLSHINKFYGGDKYLKYKIEYFITNLCKEKNLWCNKIYYYTAPPYQGQNPTEEEKKRKKGYDLFIQKLRKINLPIEIREGKLLKLNSGEFIQKGVDTWLTTDLLLTSQRKETSNIILISADTDFIPILNIIRKNYGISITLAYFADNRKESGLFISSELLNSCDDKILIRKNHFLKIDKTESNL